MHCAHFFLHPVLHQNFAPKCLLLKFSRELVCLDATALQRLPHGGRWRPGLRVQHPGVQQDQPGRLHLRVRLRQSRHRLHFRNPQKVLFERHVLHQLRLRQTSIESIQGRIQDLVKDGADVTEDHLLCHTVANECWGGSCRRATKNSVHPTRCFGPDRAAAPLITEPNALNFCIKVKTFRYLVDALGRHSDAGYACVHCERFSVQLFHASDTGRRFDALKPLGLLLP